MYSDAIFAILFQSLIPSPGFAVLEIIDVLDYSFCKVERSGEMACAGLFRRPIDSA
jgi:hypothetical protein